MSIAFKSAESTNGSAASASWTINKPASLQAGDFALLLVASNLSGLPAVLSPPDGFTLVRRVTDGTNTFCDIYWKIITANEPAWSITYDGSNKITAHAAAYSGVDAATPFVAEAGAGETGTSVTAHMTPTIETLNNESWLVSFGAERNSLSTWTGADTERLDSAGGGTNPISAFTQDSNGAVAAGSYSRALTSSLGSSSAVMWIGALKAAGPTVSAGNDQSVESFETVTLHGNNSHGTYVWTQSFGPAVTLSSTTVAEPTFTCSGVNESTTIIFQLTDAQGVLTDTVTITVRPVTELYAKNGAWEPLEIRLAVNGSWI